MKSSIAGFSVCLMLLFASIPAFGECTDPHFLEGIDRLKRYSERSAEGAGDSIAKPITVNKLFDYAPMSEDFGPERIGPSTFSRIYKDYLNDMERGNVRFTKSVVDQDLSTLTRLCEEAQKQGGGTADVMQIFGELEKTRGTPESPGVGFLVGGALALLLGFGFVRLKRARPEAASGTAAIPIPGKKTDDSEKNSAKAA